MFRYCEDNTYIIVIVAYGSCTWSYGLPFIVPEMTLIISVRMTLFWRDFDLHCGLAITVVERLQRYNCIWLTYIDNVEQNILFYIEAWKLWDTISMWKTDLEKEPCVLTILCIQKKVVQTPCVNHFVLEKLVTSLTNELVIHVLDENQFVLRTFGSVAMILNSSSEIEFCRLLAAGIVSTNLYLKNLRFVNWKPEIEFTSWDIGSKDWCQKFI